ncbi:MAG: IS1380 family transposase [Bacteroidales bacterium]|nr:IS1380 family transposase [Bacteroidales bacterium]
MKKFRIVLTDERIIPSAGLSVVGAILGKSDFVKRANRMDVTENRSQHQIKNGDILLTYIGLQCMGKPQYEAVRELEDDPDFYKAALGIAYKIPSQETLRQRMDDIGDSMRSQILKENVTMLKANGIVPSRLENGFVPVDLDVSPFDNSKTKKEGVERTYKGCDGYAPMFAYIGREGYLVSAELREGSQHCQNGTPAFLREMVPLCKELTSEPLLFRLDSGNDAAENLGILLENGCYFIIKHNLRRETPAAWLAMAEQNCKDIRRPRDGKTVYVGSDWKPVTYTAGDGSKKQVTLRIGYEIIVREIDKHGQFLIEPDIEINTWWTNLGFKDDDIIDLYHKHGTMEQYHSEIKTDMDLERLPSGKFKTNALVLELAILSYNILRMIGQEALGHRNPRVRKTVKRRRLRTVINDLINLACHVTTHARRMVLGLGRSNVWRDVFESVYGSFAYFQA